MVFNEAELNDTGPESMPDKIFQALHVHHSLQAGFWCGLKGWANSYLGTLRQQVNTNLKKAYLGELNILCFLYESFIFPKMITIYTCFVHYC